MPFLPQNPKLARLRSDAERWAFIAALCSAKTQPSEGEWKSADHFKYAVGPRVAKHLDALVEAGLLEWGDDGSLEVHDWESWQPKDATAAERSKRYRDKRRGERSDTRDDTPSHTEHLTVTPLQVTPSQGRASHARNGHNRNADLLQRAYATSSIRRPLKR
jgi:hypothetical protein